MNAAAGTPSPRYRGRYAPSPTGPLHFGSLVAAVASYCDARASDGQWLLRIEDVDLPRAQRGADAAILATLERYGFAWDGPVARQSERTDLYTAALDRLRSNGDTYECACSRRELDTAVIGPSGERVYPGTCRHGIRSDRRRARHSVRVKVGDARIDFRDRLQGPQSQDLARDVGDFVVRRADGLHAYQLAVVVDDAIQGVTHVVRGADLLASTPRQIFLQQRLGYAPVSYLHVPVAIDANGEKLSKQTGASALPDDPVPALIDAWRFLGQQGPEAGEKPVTAGEFWAWALPGWNPTRLPPTAMLPAPRQSRGAAPGKV